MALRSFTTASSKIIANYVMSSSWLVHAFPWTQDTDTEVIAHLVNQQLKKGCEPVDALRAALQLLAYHTALEPMSTNRAISLRR